jgi:hypothetical protein
MNTKKIYINTDNEGQIVCPSCHKAKTINVANYRNPLKPIRVKCQCGHNFSITLEYRKANRKTVNIPGKLFHKQSSRHIADVVVTSLSIAGVGFELKSHIGIKVVIKPDDLYEIAFTLDDNFDSAIREEIVVRRVEGNRIGAEFADQEKYHYELDFYLSAEFPVP